MELLRLLLQLLEATFGIDVDWVFGDLALRKVGVSGAGCLGTREHIQG